MMANTITPGVYRHYKGKSYRVITTATHTETMESMVVYIGLYDSGPMWVRPIEQFTADVEFEGQLHPRFKRIGD
jgi:hypothetical protein